jgi:hypothetical protein
MSMRRYIAEDYATIQDWWEGNDAFAPDPALLSKDGLIVEDLAASWLYTGNSAIAFIGWPVINPKAGKLAALKALESIFKEQADEAQDAGCLVVFAYTDNPALLKLMSRIGFRIGDQLVTNMILGV